MFKTMKLIITESQVEVMKKYMNDMLERESDDWSVAGFSFREMMITTESGRTLFSYSTNNDNYGELSDILYISSEIIDMVEGFLPLMDEYYIAEWFSKKYKRRVDQVVIWEED